MCLSAVGALLPPGWMVVGLCSRWLPWMVLPDVEKVDAATSCSTAGVSGAGSASSPSAENSDSDSE